MTDNDKSFLADLLPIVLGSEANQSGGGITVVHAGHYFLDAIDEHACDHLDSGPAVKPAIGEFVQFTRTTWEIACRALAAANSPGNIEMMILVNDWQFLVPKDPVRRRRDSKAALMRSEYYKAVREIPAFHLKTMQMAGISPDRIFRASEDRWLFSESALRLELAATISELRKDATRSRELGLHECFTKDGQPIVNVGSDGQEYSLLYCGNTNCAGEVVELLRQLYGRGVRSFINIYPAQCLKPVETGTALAERLFGLDGMKVTNIAVSCSSDHSCDPVVEYHHFPSD